jgi:uncharacterized protein (TIGR04255 family)
MTKHYLRPPLQEALCELRFDPGAPWDWTVPGLLWERIRDRFPSKQGKSVLANETGSTPPLPPELQHAMARVQFFSEDGSSLVQVGPNLLTVNFLPPYAGWPTFLPLIDEMVGMYREIATPAGLSRVGLRYINKVQIPGTDLDLSQFFVALPVIPAATQGRVLGFLSVADIAPPDGGHTLRYTLGTANSDEQQASAFLLDLDASKSGPDAPSWDLLHDSLDSLHASVEGAFEGTFTGRTHTEVFGELPE